MSLALCYMGWMLADVLQGVPQKAKEATNLASHPLPSCSAADMLKAKSQPEHPFGDKVELPKQRKQHLGLSWFSKCRTSDITLYLTRELLHVADFHLHHADTLLSNQCIQAAWPLLYRNIVSEVFAVFASG